MTPLLFALPWLLLLAFLVIVVREPSELPPPPPAGPGTRPQVSVIVPARDEALNIEACLTSLAASTYPDFEIVVVDDRSSDGTGRIARSIDRGGAQRLIVIDGEELPSGWLGKPWACWQGAGVAEGELLAASPNERALALQDLVWALLNAKEFLFRR
jgi:chlorobactene glucosyltransferase